MSDRIPREQWLAAIVGDPEAVADLLENLQEISAITVTDGEIMARGVVVAHTKGSTMSPITTTGATTSEVGRSTEEPQ